MSIQTNLQKYKKKMTFLYFILILMLDSHLTWIEIALFFGGLHFILYFYKLFCTQPKGTSFIESIR